MSDDARAGESVDDPAFLEPVAVTPRVQAMYDEDLADNGYVMNLTRVWARSPEAHERFWEFVGGVTRMAGLDVRRRGILVAATASTLGDPYCSLAWGRRLASAAGESTAAGVLAGGEEGLTAQEAVLARWARKIAADATSATADDVRELSEAGFTDDEIFAITAYVAGRIAFSTVNNALGARPDRELIAITPDSIRDAVARLRPRQAAKN